MGNQGSYSTSYTATPEGKKVIPVQDVALNTRLFNELLKPKMPYIRSLVHYYRNAGTDEEYIYSVVLEKLFRYIHTYDREKKLDTWIHISVKRYTFKLNKDRQREAEHRTGVEFDDIARTSASAATYDGKMERRAMLDEIPDEVYMALMQIPEYKLRPFMLYVQGYTIQSIAEMECEQGHTESVQLEVVRGRVFWTRNKLQKLLREYGRNRRLRCEEDAGCD